MKWGSQQEIRPARQDRQAEEANHQQEFQIAAPDTGEGPRETTPPARPSVAGRALSDLRHASFAATPPSSLPVAPRARAMRDGTTGKGKYKHPCDDGKFGTLSRRGALCVREADVR